ncbi:MAG: shikimate dehydrogenase [Flavobacteriales bacterium]|nr:shikimate dehydrogenase [Flavobacteriales bacterium]
MKQFGLIGKTLGHSFSKSYFEDKFEKEHIENASYDNFPLEVIEEFKTLIKERSFSGMNVTIPYKVSIIPMLDELSEEVQSIGAVNTIQFINNKLIGYNTDYIGFHNSLKPFLANTMDKALILGTGGASKAVVYALEKIGITCLCVSRKPEDNQLSYEELNEFVLKHHLLIVNTTPLGTSPNIDQCPDIPYQFITEHHLLMDLVYNPAETLFLKKGKEKGANILNGKSMLVHQAEEAWKIWNT